MLERTGAYRSPCSSDNAYGLINSPPRSTDQQLPFSSTRNRRRSDKVPTPSSSSEGPIAAEKIVEHAARETRDRSYNGAPMHSVSVSLTVGGRSLEDCFHLKYLGLPSF